jgi:hypothetical protein
MSRTAFVPLAAIALLGALVPFASSHSPNFPLPFQFCGDQHLHHYTAATSVDTTLLTTVYWRTTVQLFDSCPFDGEPDYGIGGAFLPSSHHGTYDPNLGIWKITACADDDLWGPATGPTPVGLIVGVDTGGGVILDLADGFGCVTASYPGGPGGPGAAPGFWVFLANSNAGVTPRVPTVGHIYDI